MIITRLRLANFRRHRALDVKLGPGLNVVRGANEAGKSTVQRAIEMALFRRPTFSGNELDDTRPWQDPGAEPTIDLDFTDDARPGTIHKVFAGGKGTVATFVGLFGGRAVGVAEAEGPAEIVATALALAAALGTGSMAGNGNATEGRDALAVSGPTGGAASS